MRFCQEHWNLLITRVKEEGLEGFISENRDEALGKVQHLLEVAQKVSDGAPEENWTKETFDPLLNAMFEILSQLVDTFGPGIALANGCPLCTANGIHLGSCKDDACDFSYDEWLIYAAHAQRHGAEAAGLIPTTPEHAEPWEHAHAR